MHYRSNRIKLVMLKYLNEANPKLTELKGLVTKNGMRPSKMASLVYERENCDADAFGQGSNTDKSTVPGHD